MAVRRHRGHPAPGPPDAAGRTSTPRCAPRPPWRRPRWPSCSSTPSESHHRAGRARHPAGHRRRPGPGPRVQQVGPRSTRSAATTSRREIERDLVQVPWAPRVNISARTGRHMDKLVPALETALDVVGHPRPDGPAQRVPRRDRRGAPAPGARRQAAADPVRHPGRRPGRRGSSLFAQRLPRGRLPALHRAPAARGVRLRRAPRSRSRCGCGRSAAARAERSPGVAGRSCRVRRVR